MRSARPLIAILALTACDDGKSRAELAKLDRARAAASDPAVTAALADPIMTDGDLSVADNSRRIRDVGGPVQAIYPKRVPGDRAFGALDKLVGKPDACLSGFVIDKAWATRLGPPFPLYPGAALIEAAGNVAPCRARFAAFRTRAVPAAVVGWYADRAVRAGYSATLVPRGSDSVVTGKRGADSYYVIAEPRGSGSEVSLITDGR